MKNLNQLKPAFIAGISLLVVLVSCKREDTYSNSYPTESSTGLRQVNGSLISCSNARIEDHFISFQYGLDLISNYQKASKKPGAICTIFDKGGWVLAESFPVEAVQRIIAQKGCCSFRIYNGLDSDNRQHLVMVGVNEKGSDIFYCNSRGTTDPATEDSCTNIGDLGLIIEMGSPCPYSCKGVYTGP